MRQRQQYLRTGGFPSGTIAVQVYPTLIFLDDKGREIVRNDGALSTTGFLELAQRALAQQGL